MPTDSEQYLTLLFWFLGPSIFTLKYIDFHQVGLDKKQFKNLELNIKFCLQKIAQTTLHCMATLITLHMSGAQASGKATQGKVCLL